jgi:arylformamidase
MKIIDLSHLIHPDMPVFPETKPPILQQDSILKENGFREIKITFDSHTGTHIDAPGHMLNDGFFLDNMNIGHFFGKATILNFCSCKKPLIARNELSLYYEKISKVDFVIIKTRWSQYWGKSQYYENYPYLSNEAAEWLSGFNLLKGVGIDTISIDGPDSTDFTVHKILLSKNMIIIENLTNLNAIKNEFFMLSVLPLKIKNADGSPVRAIAIEEI